MSPHMFRGLDPESYNIPAEEAEGQRRLGAAEAGYGLVRRWAGVLGERDSPFAKARRWKRLSRQNQIAAGHCDRPPSAEDFV